jgi:putative FmdB family regulatory protein
MPTYEYACRSCGEHHDVVQKFGDDPLTTCPSCGGPLRKVFGAVGVVFKGSGFYKTDSRAATKNGKADKSEKSDKPEKADKSDKSDKTPATADSGGSASSSSSGSKSPDSAGSGSGSSPKSGEKTSTGKAAAAS